MSLKTTIRKLFGRLGFEIVRSRRSATYIGFPADFTEEECRTVKAVRPYTMTTGERIVSLVRATEYVVKNNIPGALVECGVWRGGSAMVMALTLERLGVTDRDLYLYDTFEGMPAPTNKDLRASDNAAAGVLLEANPQDEGLWCRAGLEEVRANVLSTGYPRERIHFVQGLVEQTLPAQAPERIALLRLDTDWYESTRHELEHLYPRLSSKGVLILDDYNFWKGAKKATDEYFASQNICVLLQRVDTEACIAVKP
jgi:predicted O-methyltransferase YrrM